MADRTPEFGSSGGRRLAVVTGGSQGIGLELAKLAARDGFDLIVAADRDVDEAVDMLSAHHDVAVTPVTADLATKAGIDAVAQAIGGRDVDLLFANAGHGLGDAFLDQDFAAIQHVIDTNVTGTIDLIQRVGRRMRARGQGRILITGSIAGIMPGSYQAVYHGSKAFIDSFAFALRNELKATQVTVTVLMPGATETEFFDRAHMERPRSAGRRRATPPRSPRAATRRC